MTMPVCVTAGPMTRMITRTCRAIDIALESRRSSRGAGRPVAGRRRLRRPDRSGLVDSEDSDMREEYRAAADVIPSYTTGGAKRVRAGLGWPLRPRLAAQLVFDRVTDHGGERGASDLLRDVLAMRVHRA